MKKVLFISSGGGHLEELLKLQEVFKTCDFHIISEKTASTNFLQQRYGIRSSYLLYGTKDHLFAYLFIFPINIILSLFYFIVIRPEVVITTGTHTAVPMMYIARWMKCKTIYIETFANRYRPTKTGKLLYGKTDLFIVQWKELLEVYPDAEFWGWIY